MMQNLLNAGLVVSILFICGVNQYQANDIKHLMEVHRNQREVIVKLMEKVNTNTQVVRHLTSRTTPDMKQHIEKDHFGEN